MLAEKNEYIAETAATVYRLTQDERVRMECEAREDLYRTQLGIQRRLERLGVLEATNEALESRSAELESKSAELESKSAELESKNVELEIKNANFQAKNAELEIKNANFQAENAELKLKMEKLLAWARKNGYEP